MRNLLALLCLFLFINQNGFAQKTDAKKVYVDRLLSFAILAGNIQYFSPTDPVQDLYYEHGWENFYANGVRLAAEAKNERSFADSLVRLFRPIEPSLAIIYNTEVLCAPTEIIKKGDTISVQHEGLSLYTKETPQFRSIRTNRRAFLSDMYMVKSTLGKFKLPKNSTNKPNKFKLAVYYKCPKPLTLTFPKSELQQGTYRLQPDSGKLYLEGIGNDSTVFNIKIAGDDVKGLYIRCDSVIYIDEQRYLFRDLENFGLNIPSKDLNIRLTGNDEALYEEKNEIGDTLKTKLSKNLYASFPLAVYGDELSTYPLPSYNRESYPYNKGIGYNTDSTTLRNNDIKLSNILRIWNVLRISYVYNTFNKKQEEELLKETLLEAMETKNVIEYYKVVSKFLAQYKDGHIWVYINDIISDDSHSAPISIQYIEGKVYIKTLHSPELTNSLSLGDQLLEVDGIPVEKIIEELSQYISGNMNTIINNVEFRLLYGKKGSSVKLKFRSSGQTKILEVKRDFAHKRRYLGISKSADRSNRLLRPDTYYFNTSESDITDTLIRFINDPSKNIVFDMRGYLTSDIENKGLINKIISDTGTQTTMYKYQILSPYRKRFDPLTYTFNPESTAPKAKMYFLVDKSTISAAETFISRIKDWKVGKIIGEPTAGANGDVNYFSLPGGLSITFSAIKVLNSDGSDHHLVGILPDYPVTYSLNELIENRDPFIEKALNLIKQNTK